MKYLRILLAALSLSVLTAVFIVPATYLATLLLGWLPRAQLVPALLAGNLLALGGIILSVLLFGRFYCSVICPLGISQDLARTLLRFAKAPRLKAFSRPVRYAILALFLIGVPFGFTGLIEPYGIFGRALVTITPWSIGLFAAILLVTAFGARWWCNQVCPVGTLLSLFSRFAFFRVRIDSAKCVNCGRCARVCDKGAIERNGKQVTLDLSKCVTCLNCKGVCEKHALSWR